MHIKVLDCEDLFAQLAGHKIWIEDPTWLQIEEAIDDLDGNGRSIVVLQKEINFLDGEYMVIGGGGSNHNYICLIRTPEPDQLDWQLINPSGSTSETTKILVSEFVELNLRDCATYTDVLQAAETYTLSGTRDESLHWEQVELKTKFTWLEEKVSSQNLTLNTTDESNQSETEESPRSKRKELPQLQQELNSDKKQLQNFQAKLKKVEQQIENSRRTNIFGRPQSGLDETERDKLVQSITEIQEKIAQNESLLEGEKDAEK